MNSRAFSAQADADEHPSSSVPKRCEQCRMRGAGRNLADGAGGMKIDERLPDLSTAGPSICEVYSPGAVTDEQGRRGHVATRHA
jgi:hypothetical protein